MVFTFKGTNVAETIVRFAKEYRVGQIVLGRPRPIAWWKRLFGKRSVAEEIVLLAQGFTVVIVDAEADEVAPAALQPPPSAAATASQMPATRAAQAPAKTASFGTLLTEEHILVFSDPVTKETVLRQLLECLRKTSAGLDVEDCLRRIEAREQEGSTFLNEGVAFPHVKLPGISNHEVALAVTRAGISDVSEENPIQVVVLILSPKESTDAHVQILAAAARLMKNRPLRQKLIESHGPGEALECVRSESA
jgi:mannitol/fructose-specific phosphotransferase system IIA component (Ntr-type)